MRWLLIYYDLFVDDSYPKIFSNKILLLWMMFFFSTQSKSNTFVTDKSRWRLIDNLIFSAKMSHDIYYFIHVSLAYYYVRIAHTRWRPTSSITILYGLKNNNNRTKKKPLHICTMFMIVNERFFVYIFYCSIYYKIQFLICKKMVSTRRSSDFHSIPTSFFSALLFVRFYTHTNSSVHYEWLEYSNFVFKCPMVGR